MQTNHASIGNQEQNLSGVQSISIGAIKPSPENAQLYRPVSWRDADVQALARGVKKDGILEPLVATLDGYIISGHRRHMAAQVARLKTIPCRHVPFRKDEDPDRFVRLLREYNRQRVKDVGELLREAVVEADPGTAYEALMRAREQKSDMSDFCGLTPVAKLDRRRRRAITSAKEPMLQAILEILEERRQFWPLSDRQVHYALLNDPPLRHARKLNSRYCNDNRSWKDLCDLLTRGRLEGRISWEALTDETRPVLVYQGFENVQHFASCELDRFLGGYWRNYQRTQPRHVEIVGEKLTLRGVVEPIARRYGMPLTIGRGYCSIMPRREMALRFMRSGKASLVILILSDHDPEGVDIAESFQRSMRDDFGIEAVDAFKVAITPAQVQELGLPARMKAKEKSSRRRGFVEEHGEDVFELEAIPPAKLTEILEAAVLAVMDRQALEREWQAERSDAAFLQTARQRALLALRDITTPDGGK